MWLNYLFAAFSGCIYILACSPTDQYYLMWVAFIPLFFAVERIPENKRNFWILFRLGFTTAFFMAATGFYWLIHATQNYGGIPMWVSILVYLAFCFTNQLQVPFYLLLRHSLKGTRFFQGQIILPAFILGLMYTGIEAFNPKLFADTMGSAFYLAPWVRQLADIGGPLLITIFAMTINEILFSAIFNQKFKLVFTPLLMGIAICFYGYYRNNEFKNLKAKHSSSEPLFRAAMIQGNIGDFIKVAAEHGEKSAVSEVLGSYVKLSEQALQNQPPPDAIIWPETAYPAIYGRPYTAIEAEMQQMLRDLMAKIKGYLIFGGYDSDVRGQEYNSIFFIHASSQDKEVYHKSMLLMFGETLPFADSFPSLKSYFPTMGFFGRGPGPDVIPLKNAQGEMFQLAPSICYEALFPDFSVEGALKGADALLNVTNDSWFGEHGEPYQHLSLTRFRSIETRLPLLRATNTGFTVWIDPTGDQIKSTELSKPDVLLAELSHRIFPESPYMRISKVFGSNWLIRLCQLAVAFAFAWLILKKNKMELKQK